MLTDYDVIKTLLVTEKGTHLNTLQNKHIFSVDVRANKIQIRQAVENIYKVKVTKVNVINVPGKFKRMRYRGGYTSRWKKAIVTLKKGDKIEIAQ